MKKLFITLIIMVLAMNAYAFAYDFSAVCESGQTLYYSFVSDSEVEVVRPYSDWNGPAGNLIIPNSVEYQGVSYNVVAIGEHTFLNCSELTSVEIPNSVTNIKYDAFSMCENLSSVVFSNALTSIGHLAFSYCTSLSGELILPSSLHDIGSCCFENCSSLSGILTIPESVSYIGDECFTQCTGFTGVVFPDNIQTIPGAFAYCTGLSGDLIIPDQCTSIKPGAFFGCSNLSSLTIGAAVETIHRCAFADCTGLESIVCKTPTFPFCEYYEDRRIFENVPTDIPVYVNCLTIDQFQMSQDWSQFTNMQGVFFGTPELTVGVNNPDYGTAEVVFIPEDCDQLTATVRAIPNPGHHFGYWKSGTIISFDEEYTFTLRNNTTLTAYFDCIAIINDEIAFPDHINGRKINASGQVTEEYPSDFIYDEEGVMTDYTFPGTVSTQYHFLHFPSRPSYFNSYFGGHPITTEQYYFTYNSYDQIEHSDVYHWGVGDDYEAHYYYYYDNEHRLIKKEYFDEEYCFLRFYYAYSNGNRTRIDSVVYYHPYNNQVDKTIQTTNHYNQRIQPLTVETETFNGAGELTAYTLQTHSYTSNNKTDSIITQTFTDGEWVNSGLTHYVYDDKNRVVEYQTGLWSADNEDWSITKRTIYDFHDEEQKLIVSFKKKNGGEWIWDSYSGQKLFYKSELYEWQRALSYYINLNINQLEIDLHYGTKEIEFPWQSEWYYEIVWDDGSITYQHLECVGDTLFDRESRRPKVIVRSNTHYDRDTITEVTHEYLYEEGNKVYWWNKDLQEFTTLYDYNAEIGDEWEIKVGTESIIVHVDNVSVFEYQGETYKMLTISDEDNIFNGDIVVGFGHMTSFFPEKLMNRGKGFRVDGLRCYWVEDALLYHYGDEDCDAIHSELQNVEEDGPSTSSGTFAVYPNPTIGVLFVETRLIASLPDPTYHITNLMGQTLLQGHITAEKQQIDIANLPSGMYFISVGEQILKFVKQ